MMVAIRCHNRRVETLRRWVAEWPEAAAAALMTAALPVAIALDGSALDTEGRPSRLLTAATTILGAVLLAALIAGSERNRRLAASGIASFWSRVRWAFTAFLLSSMLLGAAEMLSPSPHGWGPDLAPSGGAALLLAAGGAGWAAGFVLLGSAVIARARFLANPARSRAVLLDSTAAAIALATPFAMLFTGSARPPDSLLLAAVALPAGVVLGLWCLAVLIASLSLVPLARGSGRPAITEVCISAAMLLALAAVVIPFVQLVEPGLIPKLPLAAFGAPIAAALASVAERRSLTSGGLSTAERGPESQAVGGFGPVFLAFLLPVAVVGAAMAGLPTAKLAVGGAGTALVCALVMMRLALTIRENSRLYSRTHELAEVSTALFERSTREREEERMRLATQLHDGALQELTAAHLWLSLAERVVGARAAEARGIAEASHGVRRRVEELRKIVMELRPPVLDELGLAAAVEELILVCEARGIATTYANGMPVRVEPDQEIALYRIAQEAIGNVLAHAGATRLEVRLQPDGDDVLLLVEDNGSGFEFASELQLLTEGKVGLAAMRRRATMAGISLSISSSPGNGTTVTATALVSELAAARRASPGELALGRGAPGAPHRRRLGESEDFLGPAAVAKDRHPSHT